MSLKVLVKHKVPKRMAAFLENAVPNIDEQEEEDSANAAMRERADPEYLIHSNILKLKASFYLYLFVYVYLFLILFFRCCWLRLWKRNDIRRLI